MQDKSIKDDNKLYSQIAKIIADARTNIRHSINSLMVMTYREIGKIIIENEQNGEYRAAYGEKLLTNLSDKLTAEFGAGFDVRNLQHMKKFYITFPNANALRTELSWTHYRLILKIANPDARKWYMDEAVKENWSTRALERQINSFYYERLLSSQIKDKVISECRENTKNLSA